MNFEKIPANLENFSSYIKYPSNFKSFIEDFNITGVHWSEPSTISSSYFLKLLQLGSSARLRKNDFSNDLHKYYNSLFDHGALWKTNDNTVICTCMPYAKKDQIIESFNDMLKEFNYPSNVKLEFLDDKYRYRPNGDFMILIYFD